MKKILVLFVFVFSFPIFAQNIELSDTAMSQLWNSLNEEQKDMILKEFLENNLPPEYYVVKNEQSSKYHVVKKGQTIVKKAQSNKETEVVKENNASAIPLELLIVEETNRSNRKVAISAVAILGAIIFTLALALAN